MRARGETVESARYLVNVGTAALCVLAILGPRIAVGQTKRLDVDGAVRLALADSPQIRGAGALVDGALAKQKAIRGRFLPLVQVKAHAMYFSEAPGFSVDMAFDDPGMPPTPESGFDGELLLWLDSLLSPLLGLSDAFEGNQYDVDVTVSVVQPLTPLVQVGLGHKIAGLGVEAARVGVGRQRADVALKARTAFYRTLQARAGARALREAVKTVEAHVARARAFHEQDLIGRNDLLEAEVRLAQLRGQLVEAANREELAAAALALTVGLPQNTQLELVDPPAIDEPAAATPLEQLQELALDQRQEIHELRLRIAQAQGGVRLSRAAFLPQLNAMGSYHHNEGSLMEAPTWTVGAMLQWNVWEWGATYYEVGVARAQLAAASAGLDGLERGIRLQVRQAFLAVRAAREQIGITEAAIGHAREQLRLEQARYEQQHATSTDVLDAQMRLTRASVNHEVARYGLFIALAALGHATGETDERE